MSPNVTLTKASLRFVYVEIKCERFSARSSLAFASPRANKTLSMILLLPEPFGPDTVVNPFKKGISDLLANDLKLSISSCFIYIILPNYSLIFIRQQQTGHVKNVTSLLIFSLKKNDFLRKSSGNL